MFVFKKGRLIRTVEPISEDEYVFTLRHPSSGMQLAVNFNSDPNDLGGREGFLVSPKTDTPVNMTSPYRVFKEEEGEEGVVSYKIYQEFWDKKKPLVENFLDAIHFFEEKIYEELKETPPETETPKPDDEEKETFIELPAVGDIIKKGKKYGNVMDVNDQTRNIKIKVISKKEALDTLKRRKQSYAKGGTIEDKINALNFAKGGIMYSYDELANEEFGMDYDQLGENEKEWVRDEQDIRFAKGGDIKTIKNKLETEYADQERQLKTTGKVSQVTVNRITRLRKQIDELSAKKLSDWIRFVLDNKSWFEPESYENKISLITRENAVCDDGKCRYGEEDLREAKKIRDIVEAKYTDTDIQIQADKYEEYVVIHLELPQGEYAKGGEIEDFLVLHTTMTPEDFIKKHNLSNYEYEIDESDFEDFSRINFETYPSDYDFVNDKSVVEFYFEPYEEYAKGGKIDKEDKDTNFITFNVDDDKIIILRSEEKGECEDGSCKNDEPTPENIEDPFSEDTPPKSEDSKDDTKDSDADDSDKDEDTKEDLDKEDGDETDAGEEQDEAKGTEEDKEETKGTEEETGDDNTDDEQDVENDIDEKDELDENGDLDKDIESSDDEWGEAEDEKDLATLLGELEEASEKGEIAETKQAMQDGHELEKFLNTGNVKETFKTKRAVKSIIGDAPVFKDNNETRINEALEQIFK